MANPASRNLSFVHLALSPLPTTASVDQIGVLMAGMLGGADRQVFDEELR